MAAARSLPEYAAPTELAMVLVPASYKDVAPTELGHPAGQNRFTAFSFSTVCALFR